MGKWKESLDNDISEQRLSGQAEVFTGKLV